MKKIKKIFTIGLAVLLIFCVASCMKIDKTTKWYSEKALTTTGLENLPKPNFEYKGYDGMEYSIDGKISEDVFYTYAQQLLDYMNDKYDCFGTSGEAITNPSDSSPMYRYVECEKELKNYRFETKKEDGTKESINYLFVYFREEPNSTVYRTSWKIQITYWLAEQAYRIQDDKGTVEELYRYNFRVELRRFGVSTHYVCVDKYLEESYEKQYPGCGRASILHYYNRNSYRDHFAVMITATGVDFGQVGWTENIGDYIFHYQDGNRILFSFDYSGGLLFTLTEAYERGLIYDSELANIERQHREFYPELYEIEQGL